MNAEKCPYCGTVLTTSLRFCVSCRRSVTEIGLKKIGENTSTGLDAVADNSKRFKLAKKEYSLHRQIRTFFFYCSTLMMLYLAYYCTMKFILHKPVPGQEFLQPIIEKILDMLKTKQ